MNAKLLTNIGISEKAAHVYLTALALGTASIQELANKTNFKRPTVYGYVEELTKQGLLEKSPLGKRDYYRARDPRLLETRAEQTAQAIRKIVPELEMLHASISGRPSITILEGEKGLRQVYKEMENANSLCFWSNLEMVERQFHDVFEKLATTINEQQIKTREIISNTPEAQKSSKKYAALAGRSYSAHLATTDGITNDSAIYGNVVALFRLHENNLFVIRIEDASIAQTFKALFDMAWKGSDSFIN